MTKRFYVRNGNEVRGPFSGAKIKSALASGAMLPSAQVANKSDGPWRTVTDVPQLASLISIQTVGDFEIAKSLTGQWYATFTCPWCNADLRSNEAELSSPDQCPECFRQFVVSGDALDMIESSKKELKKQRDDRQARKSEARAERRAKREAAKRDKLLEREARKQLQAIEIELTDQNIDAGDVPDSEVEEVFYDGSVDETEVELELVRPSNSVERGRNQSGRRHSVPSHGQRTGRCWYCKCDIHSAIQCPYCRMLPLLDKYAY